MGDPGVSGGGSRSGRMFQNPSNSGQRRAFGETKEEKKKANSRVNH